MFSAQIAQKLSLRTTQVDTVLALLSEGSTIPFIARYRKDQTGALDEVQIQQIRDEERAMQEFEDRKKTIITSIESQGKMTAALMEAIEKAITLTQLEDIYLPYKQKRKTKGMVAREQGLEPLADILLQQSGENPDELAKAYLNDVILTPEQALQGARDIIAEKINEDAHVRDTLRKLFEQDGRVISKLVEDKAEAAAKYKDYFDYQEKISTIPSHRTLAVLRGFLEGFLRISIEPDMEIALQKIEEMYIKSSSPSQPHLQKAVRDAYRRLLQPSLETEFRAALKQKADEEAIHVFAENLRQLLLSAPLGNKRIIAIDPGYRTGCKVVCLDEKGELQETTLIYVHEKNRGAEAVQIIKRLAEKYHTEAFAIGDGTAGRETEQFIRGLGLNLPVYLVNEDGASIYSASEIARQEFPDQDITIRGAVSIGRRLLDPLAELVKIDPKSIGVGQYQHDVNQSRLKERLDQTVMSCVNNVGVNINTASKHLLSYVSGIGSTLADNIIRHRREHGKFSSRKELLAIPRLGGKAFEQCAGFLRIPGAANALDNSSVHPEAYTVVEKMAADLQTDVQQLIGNESLLQKIPLQQYVDGQIGMHTLQDLVKELKKPGLDPRKDAEEFQFAAIYAIEDVQPGMELPGIVTNITRFGAFVDIGVKQDGLVHVSEISHTYIQDPSEALKLNQRVQVKVTEVDVARKRIALSIKQLLAPPARQQHAPRPKQAPVKKEPATMHDALAELKKKFGK